MITITNEIHNQLVDTFKERAKNFEWKGKKYREMQAEFFTGAVRAFDILNASDKSCITPYIFFSILRGDLIEAKVDTLEGQVKELYSAIGREQEEKVFSAMQGGTDGG